MKTALLAVILLAPVLAASAAEQSGMVSGSLIEGLKAIERPELGGVFAYVGEQNAPRAFADMLARDPNSLKKYSGKLKNDLKAAGGTTAWDHEVCANLVNYFSTLTSGKPKEKVLKPINESVLSPVKELGEIVAKRGGK